MTSKLEEWAKFITEEESDAAQRRTPVKFYANDNFYNGRISGALWLLKELEEWCNGANPFNGDGRSLVMLEQARKLCGKEVEK